MNVRVASCVRSVSPNMAALYAHVCFTILLNYIIIIIIIIILQLRIINRPDRSNLVSLENSDINISEFKCFLIIVINMSVMIKEYIMIWSKILIMFIK